MINDVIQRLIAKFWMKLAWKMPKRLVYFCAIRLIAFATQGEYSNTIIPELTAMDALGRYEQQIS